MALAGPCPQYLGDSRCHVAEFDAEIASLASLEDHNTKLEEFLAKIDGLRILRGKEGKEKRKGRGKDCRFIKLRVKEDRLDQRNIFFCPLTNLESLDLDGSRIVDVDEIDTFGFTCSLSKKRR